jgi:hypothetical protein
MKHVAATEGVDDSAERSANFIDFPKLPLRGFVFHCL